MWEREQVLEVFETGRETAPTHTQDFVLDNRSGRSILRRTKSIEHGWTQTFELGQEHTAVNEAGAKLSVAGMEFGALARNTVASNYRVSSTQTQVFRDALEFEVPPGVLRTVTLGFKNIWQCGSVLLRDTSGCEVARAPFRVVVGVDLDVSQHDST